MSFKRTFDAVETHSGEPMRVVTGGVPYILGDTVYGLEIFGPDDIST